MHVKIIGLGWYGEPLARRLIEKGHEVSGTSRTKKSGIRTEILSYPEILSDKKADIIVLNIPPFEEELEWFKSWNLSRDTWMIFISSTAMFPRPESKNALLLEQQEAWIQSQFSQWTILRFGGLLGEKRHPGKYLSGRKNLSGRLWPVNLIHLEDTIGATIAVIENHIIGKIIHVVSDEHPSREEFYTKYCRDNGLALPEFDMNDLSEGKIVPNDELKKFYVPKTKI